jgi:hypothetical protein
MSNSCGGVNICYIHNYKCYPFVGPCLIPSSFINQFAYHPLQILNHAGMLSARVIPAGMGFLKAIPKQFKPIETI